MVTPRADDVAAWQCGVTRRRHPAHVDGVLDLSTRPPVDDAFFVSSPHHSVSVNVCRHGYVGRWRPGVERCRGIGNISYRAGGASLCIDGYVPADTVGPRAATGSLRRPPLPCAPRQIARFSRHGPGIGGQAVGRPGGAGAYGCNDRAGRRPVPPFASGSIRSRDATAGPRPPQDRCATYHAGEGSAWYLVANGREPLNGALSRSGNDDRGASAFVEGG